MKRNSIKVNLFYNTIYQILSFILPIITAPYISRIIGAEGLGIYSYNYSIAMYFVYFSMLGILNYGTRRISQTNNNQKETNKIFSGIYSLQLIFSISFFIIYMLYSLLIVKKNIIISLLLGIYVASAMIDVSWFYFGKEEFKITSIRQIIIKLLSFISIFIFVHNKNDLWVYTLIMSLSYFLSNLLLWIFIWKKVKYRIVGIKEIKKHLKPCLVLFIPIIATSIYRITDKIMIGKIINMKNVGFYDNAEKIIMVAISILGAIAMVIMPRISNLLVTNKKQEAKELLDKSMFFAMFYGMAIAFGIASVAKNFIPFFYGKEFYPSIVITILLCITIPFLSWSTIIRNLYLIPTEKDTIYVNSVIGGAIINFVLNIILINIYGVIGAVIGTISTEIFVALYQTIKVKDDISLSKFLNYFLIFLIIGCIMSLVIQLLSGFSFIQNMNNTTTLIIKIIVGGIVYLLLSAMLIKKHFKRGENL